MIKSFRNNDPETLFYGMGSNSLTVSLYMYRADGTELEFTQLYYEEKRKWWIGYYDHDKHAWVEKLTGVAEDQDQAIEFLAIKLKNQKKYFGHKPSQHDQTIQYDLTFIEE